MILEQTLPGNYFVYNGINSADYGVFLSGINTFTSPERDISIVSVPGRNGDVIFDNNRYTNVDIVFSCFIPRDFTRKFNDFKAAILSDVAYHRLESTYDPECFRDAYELSENEESHIAYLAAKRMELTEGEYLAFIAEQPGSYEQSLALEKEIERIDREGTVPRDKPL